MRSSTATSRSLDLLGDAIEDVQDTSSRTPGPRRSSTSSRSRPSSSSSVARRRPIREIFNQLTNRDLALIDDDEVLYFRDVYDHLIRLTDELDNYRELVSGTLDVYLSTVNNQLSLIMKRLTGVTVVLTGIAAIAGIFGMSEAGTALGGKEAAGLLARDGADDRARVPHGLGAAQDRLDLGGAAGAVRSRHPAARLDPRRPVRDRATRS